MCSCPCHISTNGSCLCSCPKRVKGSTIKPPKVEAPKREWKSGDVAMVTTRHKKGARVGVCREAPSEPHAPMGKWRVGEAANDYVWTSITSIRPLVVIDPERVPVNFKGDLLGTLLEASAEIVQDSCNRDLQEVALLLYLRDAFDAATKEPEPPKPEEPTGLGAVVEDERGRLWIHVNTHFDCSWAEEGNVGGTQAGWKCYADIPAVRVLSEGVAK